MANFVSEILARSRRATLCPFKRNYRPSADIRLQERLAVQKWAKSTFIVFSLSLVLTT